ncbi:hypothetical protein VIBNIFTn2_120152 [Vibrio nigripulchritudo FTn2]|uniref:hypothetical protein n=1 Tax=Vibrio nigripulchritudo TaxID=28173 RepID=UPI0003B18B43|nr:hypothetical protein [Vibrio nigripulchritudo]CCN40170.1 hypothetical protein VIBNIFTn2_120152 [Vibrio nigripulchritudo FTn2]
MNTPLTQYSVSGNSGRIIDNHCNQFNREFDQPRKKQSKQIKPKPLAANNLGMINKAISNLDAIGIPIKNMYFLRGAAYYQLLSEVINWAAKVFEPGMYRYKPYAIAHAIKMGAQASWGKDANGNEVLYVNSTEAGVSTFHDPSGVLKQFLSELEDKNFKIGNDWPHPWSGVPRQSLSFIMLTYPNVLKAVSNLTQPGRVATEEEIEKLIPFLD